MNNNKNHLYTSDVSVTWSKLYTPGGTVIITKGKITNQRKEKENDHPLGRWSIITIGPTNFEISIRTAYTVCNIQITLNKDKTAAHQQWTISGKNNNKNSHPRNMVIKDLINHIKNLQIKGR